jgi:UDP-N-acetyl-D-glucosamine dehydrogenase
MSHTELLNKIENRSAKIAVIGLGYVGLPLAVEFAQVGFMVTGIDLSLAKVDSLNRGQSYIDDVATATLAPLVQAGRLRASTQYNVIPEQDAIIICVPTPLRKTRDPDMSYIIAAADEIVKYLHSGLLIVLESTTYPGTTDEIIVPRIEQQGYQVGSDVFVAFSPERIDPANKTYGVQNTPKVIGGVTAACTTAACALYATCVRQVVPVSSTQTAEMVKLLENTFRAVNIGLINEIAIMCDKLGVDVWEVIAAAKTKPFGFMPFYPGPGLGGHCIPIDPLYLSWRLKSFNYNARFIELADEINVNMPRYVVTKIAQALNNDSKSVRGSHVLILGVAYKRNVDDVRESPALDVIQLLQQQGAHVHYHDPYVPKLRIDHGGSMLLDSQALDTQTIAHADVVVILTDHSNIDWAMVAQHAGLVVDTRNALHAYSAQGQVVKL